jgi:hypothetical protein
MPLRGSFGSDSSTTPITSQSFARTTSVPVPVPGQQFVHHPSQQVPGQGLAGSSDDANSSGPNPQLHVQRILQPPLPLPPMAPTATGSHASARRRPLGISPIMGPQEGAQIPVMYHHHHATAPLLPVASTSAYSSTSYLAGQPSPSSSSTLGIGGTAHRLHQSPPAPPPLHPFSPTGVGEQHHQQELNLPSFNTATSPTSPRPLSYPLSPFSSRSRRETSWPFDHSPSVAFLHAEVQEAKVKEEKRRKVSPLNRLTLSPLVGVGFVCICSPWLTEGSIFGFRTRWGEPSLMAYKVKRRA